MKKFRANATIQTHRSSYIVDISSHFFAQVCHFIDEGDLGGEKRIRGILDQLRCFGTRYDKWSLYEIERSVDVLDYCCCLLAVSSNNNPVRAHEILNRRSFTQEFWIGNYVKPHLSRLMPFDEFSYSLAGPDGHRTLSDDHFVIIHVLSQRTSNSLDLAHVWLSVLSFGSAHGNKNYQGSLDCCPQVC